MSTKQQQSENTIDPGSISFPSQTVFGVFGTAIAAGDAVERLRKAGLEDQAVRVYDGGCANVFDPSSDRRGVLAAAVQQLSDASTFMQKYAERIRAGQAVVAVRFEDDEERQTITSLLLDCGAGDVSYASGWTITGVPSA